MAGVYTDQRLNLSNPREGSQRKSRGFKPDPGNLAVRDYRGASGDVSHGGNVNPSFNRKRGNGNPPPTACRARFLSQSTVRNLRGDNGDVGIIRSPVRAIVLPDVVPRIAARTSGVGQALA